MRQDPQKKCMCGTAKAYRAREVTGPGGALTTDIFTKLTCYQKYLLNIHIYAYRLVVSLALVREASLYSNQ